MSLRTNVIMAILNLTTMAIQRQLLATMKWQSRQRRQFGRVEMSLEQTTVRSPRYSTPWSKAKRHL